MISEDLEAKRERAAEFATRNVRWNLTVLLLDGWFFFLGLAFFDATTVLPVVLKQLGASDTVVGSTRLIQVLGFTLPALFASHYLHGRVYHKSFLVWVCGVARLSLFTVPPVLYYFGATRPALALGWLLVVYGLFWTMDGACTVSWFDMVAKTIPAGVRGRFFGAMQMGMGLLGVVGGIGVKAILDRWTFPEDFALLAVFWCVGAAISEVFLLMIRETPGVVLENDEKPGFVEFIRRVKPLLTQYPRLVGLIRTRILLEAGGMAAPFYVLFAQSDLHVGAGMVGVYATIQCVGKVASAPLWGWLADRFGNIVAYRAVAICVCATPFVGLAALNGGVWLFPALFLLLGAVQDGIWMIGSNLILESVDDHQRPFAVGVHSLFVAPSALFAVIGGVIAERYSYPMAFGAALLVTSAGVVSALKVRQNRGVAN